jgi:prophage regulatory protein
MLQQQSTNPLWRLPTVVAQTGLSKSEIYRRINNGTFPKPLKWPAVEIDIWIKSLILGTAQ